MQKNETRHVLGLASEWFNEASILIAVFGILDHTFSKDGTSWSLEKGVAFLIVAAILFGIARDLKLMEKSL